MKNQKPEKAFTSFNESQIWITYPQTIRMLIENRITPKTGKEWAENYYRIQGINATIILLSALTIEGFLTHCLSEMSCGSRFKPSDDFKSRLDYEFHQRVTRATFNEFPSLFRIVLGKDPAELIDDDTLIKGVRALISFRNGLAHSKPVVYLGLDHEFENHLGQTDYVTEYEMEAQYKPVHEYLMEAKLIVLEDDKIFTAKIAAHFYGLVEPYINALLNNLPKEYIADVKHHVNLAFRTEKFRDYTATLLAKQNK
jgi:hypothetical protein